MSTKTKIEKVEKTQVIEKPKERLLSVVDVPETNEFEIHKKATKNRPTKKIRIPKE